MKKKTIKDISKLVLFIILVNLPFLTMTQLLGMNTFIDSFNNHNYYQYYKTNTIGIDTPTDSYIIIQKATHPTFSILSGDTIFYIKDEGGLACKTINHITQQKNLEKTYLIKFTDDTTQKTIYGDQIIGKIVSTSEDTIWTSVSLQLWDMSINNLNAAALFSKPQ